MHHRFAETRYGQIHYAEDGAGDPVLLLHQTPRSWDEYRDVLPRLGVTHRAVAPDTPGFGLSDGPAGRWTIEAFAAGILDLCDALGLGAVTLVGHHTGAVVAVEIAAAAPERVTGLVLSGMPYVDNTLAPFNTMIQIEKNLKSLTSLDYYKQGLSQQVQQNREVMSSLLAGGIMGTLAGGYIWGLIGAITGGVIGKIVQQTQSSENTGVVSQPELPKNTLKTSIVKIDIDKLLDHLYQAFQSIDLTVAAYGGSEEKSLKPGLENHLDLLEYLQDLMADGLNEQTQLPTAVRRRIEQAATILRRYGIETRVYQPIEEQDSGMEAWSMFYFEPSLDPQITDYITLKQALVKDNQVLLPGSVIEPASSSVA